MSRYSFAGGVPDLDGIRRLPGRRGEGVILGETLLSGASTSRAVRPPRELHLQPIRGAHSASSARALFALARARRWNCTTPLPISAATARATAARASCPQEQPPALPAGQKRASPSTRQGKIESHREGSLSPIGRRNFVPCDVLLQRRRVPPARAGLRHPGWGSEGRRTAARLRDSRTSRSRAISPRHRAMARTRAPNSQGRILHRLSDGAAARSSLPTPTRSWRR